ncbi:MAG: AraC family transcriptional regulator [Marinifilaceae bacterium]|jgi:AraC-like DNA-binding protein|nr:AraC family transcriptional regulator [Marinifilaceae bacterium]
MSQSFIIGFFLLLLSFSKSRKLGLLGVSVISISILDLSLFLENNLSEYLYLFLSSFIFLIPLFFFLYVDSLLIKNNSLIKRIITYASIVCFILYNILNTTNIYFNLELLSIYFELLDFFAAIITFAVMVIIVIQIFIHNKLIKNQYSNINRRELNWILYCSLLLLFYTIITPYIFSYFNVKDVLQEVIFFFISFFWLIGISYNAVLFKTSNDLIELSESKSIIPSISLIENVCNVNLSDSSDDISNSEEEKLFLKIKDIISKNQLFLDSDLTIANVSNLIEEHPKYVSKVINSVGKNNFNAFINTYRVNYALEQLSKEIASKNSIEGVGKMSGFKSNSVFYSSFKKIVGMTPKQYIKSL